MLRLAPAVTLAVLLGPICAGLLGTLGPAFGYLPALGGTSFSVEPWRALADHPGFGRSLGLTIFTGFAATAASLALCMALCATSAGGAAYARLQRALPPLLATPHVAIAIGFAFLIAPSGFFVRAVTALGAGWDRPPAFATVNDPYGLSLIAGLVIKETAYLALMTVAATAQIPLRASMQVAAALGYGPARAFVAVVAPRIYAQIRLPIYAALAYSLSNVEMALILGPGNPPTLSVLAVRWFAGYDLDLYYLAAAAATLQLAVVAGGIATWRLLEIPAGALHRRWLLRGARSGALEPAVAALAGLGRLAIAVAFCCLAALALWSLAFRWRYPDLLPETWSLAIWTQHIGSVGRLAGATATIAALSTLMALSLALACLENEQRRAVRAGRGALWALYLPLIVPQIAFLFGVQTLLVRLGLDGSLGAVVWAHLVFVLPYVFLSLADPYRALDPRFARSAAALGASPSRIFFAVKLPMLLKPLGVSAAIGFSVSVALYLPTLFTGAGRVATLTTEAVTLSSGGDRRVIAVYAFIQAVLPLAVYSAVLAAPAIVYRNRKGLR